MGDDLSSVGPGSRADVPTQRRSLLSHGARFCPAGCESRVRVTFPRWNIGGEWRPQFQLPAGGAGWGPPPSLVLPMASGRAFVRWPRGKAVLCSLFPRRSRKWRRRHDTRWRPELLIGALEYSPASSVRVGSFKDSVVHSDSA